MAKREERNNVFYFIFHRLTITKAKDNQFNTIRYSSLKKQIIVTSLLSF